MLMAGIAADCLRCLIHIKTDLQDFWAGRDDNEVTLFRIIGCCVQRQKCIVSVFPVQLYLFAMCSPRIVAHRTLCLNIRKLSYSIHTRFSPEMAP